MKQTSSLSPSLETSGADSASQSEKQQVHVSIGQTLAAYEKSIKDPRADHERDLHQKNNSVPIELINNQEFLAGQLEIMDRLKAEEERSIEPKKTTDMTTAEKWDVSKWILPDGTPVQNFVGPVQVNVGGIQVDADAMSKNPGSQVASGSKVKVTPEMLATPQAKAQHEELSLFFEGLMKRGGSNSPRSTTT